MALTKSSSSGVNCWIRRRQCPCGERKCYIRYEEEKSEETPRIQETTPTEYDDVATPYVGQTFETDDEAFEYYSSFARKNGFAIRRESSRSNEERGVYIRVYACHRYGPERIRTKSGERKRGRKTSVCGCEARMYILKKFIGGSIRWTIRQFHNKHNHELLEDDQVRFLPAYRKIPDADRERILSLYKAGCTVRHILKVLQLEKGGNPEHLPYIDRDVRNFLQSCKKIDRENDVSELLNICQTIKETDADFMFESKMDENGKLENIAWSYGHSIRAYKSFGDVVVFDATYREISYDRLFGVWFGMDNYGKNIFFACVLLREETAQSFGWALQAFLQFVQGKSPQTILTDLDLGLRDAVTRILPYTKHVICKWHIISKLSSWFTFPLGARYEEFKTEFEKLHSLETKKEFESQWSQMVTRYALGSNKHMCLLFAQRSTWAVPYITGCFLAKMLTPEYSKSVGTCLRGILSSRTSLKSFFQQVGIVANSRNQVGEDVIEDIPVKTSMPIEEHACSILTTYSFNLLQNELVLSMQCSAVETANGSYIVRHHKKTEGGSLVSWSAREERITCSCKEFEVSGIICRHSLRVLTLKNYFQLPERYLPTRWRRNNLLSESNNDDWSQAFQSLASTLFAESSISKERVDYVQRELLRIINHVRNMVASDGAVLNLESIPPVEPRLDDVTNITEYLSNWTSRQ